MSQCYSSYREHQLTNTKLFIYLCCGRSRKQGHQGVVNSYIMLSD